MNDNFRAPFTGQDEKTREARAGFASLVAEEIRRGEEDEEKKYRDDDKILKKKVERMAEEERRKEMKAHKKEEANAFLEKEVQGILKEKGPARHKKYHAQVEEEHQKRERFAHPAPTEKQVVHGIPITDMRRRSPIESEAVRQVDEQIANMALHQPVNDPKHRAFHPSKKQVSAYVDFEEKMLKKMLHHDPNLRVEDAKGEIHRLWLKSKENPLNETEEDKFDRFKAVALKIFKPRYPTMSQDDLDTFIEWQWEQCRKDPEIAENPETMGRFKRNAQRAE